MTLVVKVMKCVSRAQRSLSPQWWDAFPSHHLEGAGAERSRSDSCTASPSCHLCAVTWNSPSLGAGDTGIRSSTFLKCPPSPALGFADGTEVKYVSANAGKRCGFGSIPGSGRSPGGGPGKLLHYSCLENPTDRGAWWAAVHGVSRTWTLLSSWAQQHNVFFYLSELPPHLLRKLCYLWKFRVNIFSSMKLPFPK